MKENEANLHMNRFVCLLCALLLPMLTFGIHLPDLPVCEYADSEVETNLS